MNFTKLPRSWNESSGIIARATWLFSVSLPLQRFFGKEKVYWGQQSKKFGGVEIWVLPNPSGLNRAFTLDALVFAYRELRKASRRGHAGRADS